MTQYKPTKRIFLYSCGTVKITNSQDNICFLVGRFENKKELRKILFKNNDSSLIVTINFDDPIREKTIEEM